ncbi:EpsG family protein [Pseudomonas gingeri]
MIFYVFPYAFMMMTLMLGLLLSIKHRNLIFLGLLPAFLLVVLRGDVGTDTSSYLNIVRNAGSDFYTFQGEVEPGFEFLLKVMFYFLGGERFVILALSGLATVLMALSFSNKKDDVLIFFLLVFPMFFYDMTMNGLRYGISFSLAKMAYDMKEGDNKLGFLGFALLSILFHISGVVVLALLIGRRLSIGYIVSGAVFISLVFFFYADRLLYKFLAYGDLQTPSLLSGVAPLLVFFSVYMLCVIFSLKDFKYLTFLLFLEFVFYILAKFTYAGIRFQFLILYVLFCSLPGFFVMNSKHRVSFVFLILVIGMLGFSFKARNMIEGAGVGDSPFLPYNFFWNEK